MKNSRRKRKNRRTKNLIFLFLVAGVLFLVWRSIGYPGLYYPGKNAPMPSALHPEVKQKADTLVSRAAEKGITIQIYEGFRSNQEQEELYAQGRTEKGNIVTHARAGESYHNFGLAVDFALLTKDERLIWDMEYDMNGNGRSDWNEVVAIAKELGFEWGGDWPNFKDYPHLQMTFGLSIRELQWGKRPPGSNIAEK
ncbi:M15 family metallopeptidase [Bacillus sp. EB01]|uniref:M15 family metallopeptidase n=1 Tax=Bacillus sp. EB01 TaxID=1347086 RepID=UPI000693D9A2|nr:M15 family metallopeptidase [Bacillus sp. EB01]